MLVMKNSAAYRSLAAGILLIFASRFCVAAGDERSVNFSFDQVDVGAFVKLVGEITGKKFVIADGVQGRITVVSPVVTKKEVYPLFVSILESAGCTVVQDGQIFRIVALPKRETLAAPVVGTDEQLPQEGLITKIIRLSNVSPGELRKVLEPKVGGGKAGALVALDETGHLIVTDTAESVKRIERIISEVDKPGMSRTTEVVGIQFASAEDLASQLNVAMMESESRGEQLKNRLPEVAGGTSSAARRSALVVPAPHSNSMILVGTQAQIAELKRLIKEMDVDAPTGRGRMNAIFLRYMSAGDMATNINALLMRSAGGRPDTAGQKQKIGIEASTANNALLVDASPGDFDIVKKLIEQLDTLPQQVNVTIEIREYAIDDSSEFGIEAIGMQQPSSAGDTVVVGSSMFSEGSDSFMNNVQSGLFPKGITVGAAYGSYLDDSGNVVASYPGVVNLKAMKKKSNYKVLSETSLGVQNNKEATVSIVNEIPIKKSTIQGGSGSSRDVIQNIDRTDVGIKLKLMPHIIPGGEVQMVLNPSIEAIIDDGPSGDYAPTIAKREVSTTVTVQDGRTIVIAGLTRTDTAESEERIPLLGSLPLIGMLFRHTVESEEKTNILILVTPRIVPDSAAAERVMEDWQKKTELGHNEKK